MTFPFTLYVGIFCLCTGGALGCLFCIAGGKILHRHYVRCRFSCFCILFSFSIASIAAAAVLIPDFEHFFPFSTADIWWCFFLFIIGFFCAISFRIVLPSILLIYISLAFIFAIRLYQNFGTLPDVVSVRIDDNYLLIGSEKYSLKSEQMKKSSIVISVMALPPKILLPVPRVWYIVSGVDKGSGVVDFSPSIFPLSENKTASVPSFFRKWINRIDVYIVQDLHCIRIPLPSDLTSSTEYELLFKKSSGVFYPSLIRTF